MDDSTARLSASGLTCDRGERRVFAHVGFEVRPGGVLAVVGPNGAGKSSLLRLLAGLLPPAGGAITWNGQAVADEPEAYRARLHYIGHLDALKPTLTPAEMLAFHAALRGQQIGRAAITSALEAFGLAALADL